MMSPSRLLMTLCLFASTMSCGDVSRLEVDLRFSESDVEDATRQLVFVVREVSTVGDRCDALWGGITPGIGEFSRLVDYPNRNDVIVAPLQDDVYTAFVYAYSARFTGLGCESNSACSSERSCTDIGGGQRACLAPEDSAQPLAGGCGTGVVGLDSAPLSIQMELPPVR